MKSNLILSALLITLAGSGTDIRAQDQELSSEDIFDADRLLEIEIELPEEDWDSIRFQTRSFMESLTQEQAESPFTYVKGNITIDGTLIENVGIRKKGFFGSLDDWRPSLKVKFTEYVKQDPVAELDRLTLNNNRQDPSRLNQYLAYRFFNESGTIASRCNLARVTVNGTYLGIYSNVESVKKPMLEYCFGDGTGPLFEGQISDFFTDTIQRFQKKNKAAKYKPLKKIAKILEDDVVDLEKLEEYLDIEAFIRFWATESLLGVWDGYASNQNNYFMYQNPENKKLYFLPWGADDLFKSSIPLPQLQNDGPKFVYHQAVLANQLYRQPETQALYHQTMEELLEDFWIEADWLAEVDRMAALIEDELLPDNTYFTTAVNGIREFIKTRRNTITKEMRDGPVQLKTKARKPPYSEEIGSVSLAFETQWFESQPSNLLEVGDVEIELHMNGEEVAFKTMGVVAQPNQFQQMGGGSGPTILFVGERESDGQVMTLAMNMTKDSFRPTGEEKVDIGGWIIEGANQMSFEDMKMFGGTASFEAAETNQGARVAGEVTAKVVQMVGGF